MSRLGLRVVAAAMLLAVALVWLLGGPEQAGALAGLGDPGPRAAAGLVWIVLVPASCCLVPALVITAAAEGVHAIWRARGPRKPALGLGSRSGPGDT